MKKKLLFIVFISITFSISAQQDNLFQISKNLELFFSVVKELQINYADQIDPSQLTSTAIGAMLNTLDPYTTLIPEEQIQNYRFLMSGEYGGIGITSLKRANGACMIIETKEDSPASRAGLKPGDEIIEINAINLKDKSDEDIDILIKGEVGSSIALSVKKYKTNQIESLTLIREKIQLPDISYSGIIGDDIGCIRLEQFTDKSAKEFYDAFQKLHQNNNIKGLIIDLRGNGGGLLDQAVNIVNHFVEKGQLIVSTRGRNAERNRNYYTVSAPIDPAIPIVVLVDKYTASASEILAGALQDLDRAVILGEKTYGKGLVQNIVPLPYNNQLKITIAKYYIPSGRCIQAIDYFKHEQSQSVSATKPVFYTRNGRMVFEEGGIEPDISLDTVSYNSFINSLYENLVVFDFVNEFAYQHPKIDSIDKFSLNDQIYDDFIRFVNNRYEDWDHKNLDLLNQLKLELSAQNRLDTRLQSSLNEIELQLRDQIPVLLAQMRNELTFPLTSEIMNRYGKHSDRIKFLISNDPEIVQAANLLSDTVTYQSILAGTHPQCHNRLRPSNQ
ncbi:MAG TPA: S41 family peptidase [Bacteroidales bacterium]|nr:S41 family peptidase [Bacteroidales bacterium]HQQ01654.1 S41 family peptidase [Bacteroidales bacterium]